MNTGKITIQGVSRQYLTDLLNIFNDKGFTIQVSYAASATNLYIDFTSNMATLTLGTYSECKIPFKPQLLKELPFIPIEALRHYLESLV